MRDDLGSASAALHQDRRPGLSSSAGGPQPSRVCALPGCEADLDALGLQRTATYCTRSHKELAKKQRRRNGVLPPPPPPPPQPRPPESASGTFEDILNQFAAKDAQEAREEREWFEQQDRIDGERRRAERIAARVLDGMI